MVVLLGGDRILDFGFHRAFWRVRCVRYTQAMIDKYGVSESSAVARQAGGVWVGDSKVDAEEYSSKVTTAVGTYYTYSATIFAFLN